MTAPWWTVSPPLDPPPARPLPAPPCTVPISRAQLPQYIPRGLLRPPNCLSFESTRWCNPGAKALEPDELPISADLYSWFISTPKNITEGSAGSEFPPKRPAPGGNELEQFRPQKTVRTIAATAHSSKESFCGTSISENTSSLSTRQHADDGLFGGKYWCACGKKFVRNTTLRRHLKQYLDPNAYTCQVCDKSFPRTDTLERHHESQHRDGKVVCPGCHCIFRRDYLFEHLKCPQREECRVAADTLRSGSKGIRDSVQLSDTRFWISSAADQCFLPQASKIRRATLASSYSTSAESQFFDLGYRARYLQSTMQSYRGLKQRLIPGAKNEPCALCGTPLGSNTKALVEHINHHSSELSSSRHRCDDCRIGFRFAADLELHLTAARNGQCGLNFSHCFEWGSKRNQGTGCFASHHPPSDPKIKNDNHQRMHATLAIWEILQIRAHRVAISRLEAKLLLYEQYLPRPLRHSVDGEQHMRLKLIHRLSIGSIPSFRSGPAWLKFLDSMQDDKHDPQKDAGTGQLRAASMSLTSIVSADRICARPARCAPQPVLSKRSSTNYVADISASRRPGGLKSKASGVLLRTKSMTRQILADAHMMPPDPSARISWGEFLQERMLI